MSFATLFTMRSPSDSMYGDGMAPNKLKRRYGIDGRQRRTAARAAKLRKQLVITDAPVLGGIRADRT